MEVVAAASGETAKSAIVHLERESGYLLHFKRNVTTLRCMHGRLTAATNDVKTLVTAALDNDELIRQTVQDWLSRAVSVQEEANQLVAEAGHINSWFKGWCCSRFSLGRKAEKKNTVIQGLLDERSAFGDTVSDPKPFQALAIPSDPDFNAFASRDLLIKQVIESLSSEKNSLIGVHGMPGVGKTMLIKAIAKQVKDAKLFEEVVIVVVSQNPDMEKIQGDIANRLGVHFREKDTFFDKTARMLERLNKRKAVLIVLDDVWERLELAKIGIPLKNSRCKVVFTTRHKSVCNQMGADEFTEVSLLTEEDSWLLFRQKAGHVLDFTVPESISKGIVRECKGLPLAIVTLGLALNNNDDVLVWEDTLTQLKKSIFDGLSPVVSSIRLSYDFLQNETIKICFLFCCIFPEDHKIGTDLLLRYLIGENLLKNVDSMVESRGRLQSLVSKLVSSNLLLKDEAGCIMMHDMVRDVAITIASEEDKLRFIVKAGMGLSSWPNDNLSGCKRMSVMKNKLRCDLPDKLQAPQLLTLSMGDNTHLKEIPNDFFDSMDNLLILDLSGTGIHSLPSSLSRLVNLRTLLVERCYLNDISPIEELEKLEILSFRKSDVKRWPIHTGKLSNMKLLDLSDSWGKRIPAKAIASMSRLEDLSMLTVRGNLFIVDELFEVTSSTCLSSLEFHLSYDHLSTDIPILEKLIRFIVCVSYANKSLCRSFMLESRRFQRSLYLVIPDEMLQPAKWVFMLVATTEYLFLEHSYGLEHVGELDGTGSGMNDLKFLTVRDLPKIKYLVNSTAGKAPKCAFRSLEELGIYQAGNFEAFCRGGFADGSFCKLRILEVRLCSGLINLIPGDLLLRLHNLEQIVITECSKLKQLIQFEEGEEAGEGVAAASISNNSTTTNITYCPNSPFFPNLKVLHVAVCSQLEYVFQLRVARGLLQLRELHVVYCTETKAIIEGGIDEAPSDAEQDKLIFPRLEILLLKDLQELSALSPPGLTINCPCLVELHVTYCWELKRLPFRSESVPKLRLLDAQQAWFDKLEWDDEGVKPRLREVFKETRPYQGSEVEREASEEYEWKLR